MIVEFIRRGGAKRYRRIYRDGKLVSKKLGSAGGHKVGAMVAVEGKDGKVYIGWSLCKVSGDNADTFKEDRAVDNAVGRALKHSDTPLALSLVKKMNKFIERARKLYKDKEVVVSFPIGN